METALPNFVPAAIIAGLLGGLAMEVVLWFIGTAGWAKADMLVALGSLFTKERQSGFRVGVFIHAVAAILFALAYTFILVATGFNHLMISVLFGALIGFLHGLIVSLGLVWVVAERHPLEEFNEPSLAIGLSHIVGHVVYGIVVGAVIGAWPF